jgi:4'-phosphopantetheinyl transferase
MSDTFWNPAPSALVLGHGQVHLWRIVLDQPPQIAIQFERILSADEQLRADRMFTPQLRARFVAGRGMLRTILGRYLASDPADLRFQYAAQGKPSLADAAEIQFNLAHSAGLALLAVTHEQPIGVDLEAIVAHDDLIAVARRFFAPTEQQALQNLRESQRLRGFYECWVRKEAILKLFGDGLTMPLDSFVVSLDPAVPAQLLHSDHHLAAQISLASISIDDHYAAALAVGGPITSIQQYRLD